MQNLLQNLYKKNSLQEVEVETLQQLTQQHPYFAVGHYLLARKMAPAADKPFRDQLQKSIIYFHNPLWLQYQLFAEEVVTENAAPADEVAAADTPVPEKEPATFSPDLLDDVVLQAEVPAANAVEVPDVQVTPTEQEQTEQSADSNAMVVKEQSPPVQQAERFSFQAYHTVDYFASQGIRLSQEVQSNDKLGKQLKSFTEWLKTMRRLPESVAEEVLDKIDDVEIVQFAADSLEEKEVLTEAMAEVLVKQEKFARAREVYNKLSLLHPHKSAYFAAKIEDLKQH